MGQANCIYIDDRSFVAFRRRLQQSSGLPVVGEFSVTKQGDALIEPSFGVDNILRELLAESEVSLHIFKCKNKILLLTLVDART
jgi:hypothetical protein